MKPVEEFLNGGSWFKITNTYLKVKKRARKTILTEISSARLHARLSYLLLEVCKMVEYNMTSDDIRISYYFFNLLHIFYHVVVVYNKYTQIKQITVFSICKKYEAI